MLIFSIKRILQLIPTLLAIGTLVFFLLHLVPGDPIDSILGENSLPANREALRKKLNLDQPLSKQYFLFWKNIAQGNLGESISLRKPVTF
jgi:peptide/nickel transport system permease protein